MRVRNLLAVALLTLTSVGCAPTISSSLAFPNPSEVFVTTGDGNIQKPYTPVGQLIYFRSGYRLPLPILGMLPIIDIDPAVEIREGVLAKVRSMGGDAVINLSVDWIPPKDGFLGVGANGGRIVVYGTVIKR